MTQEDKPFSRESETLDLDYIRRHYSFRATQNFTLYHFATNKDDAARILEEGFRSIRRRELHLSFTPNLYKYPLDRLLAVEFEASESNPLTILDLTKIPSGSKEAAEEFSRILEILGPSLNGIEECLKVGFPGYIGPCEADDRVSISDPRELVLYDHRSILEIRLPNREEVEYLKRKTLADKESAPNL